MKEFQNTRYYDPDVDNFCVMWGSITCADCGYMINPFVEFGVGEYECISCGNLNPHLLFEVFDCEDYEHSKSGLNNIVS